MKLMEYVVNAVVLKTPRLYLIQSRIKKLIRLLDVIDIGMSNDTVMINVDRNLVIKTEGNMLVYSVDGVLMTKHKRTHINPTVNVVVNDTKASAKRALEDRELKIKINLFNRLLSSGKIGVKNDEEM